MSDKLTIMLTNTASGWNKKNSHKMQALTEQHGIENYDVHDLRSIENALDAVAKKKPDVLILNGGDGTIDAVITIMRLKSLFEVEPALIFLPGGTTNMTHKAAGYKSNPYKILSFYLEDGETCKDVTLCPLSVEVKGEKGKVFGFFLGGAAIPLVIQSTRQKFHKRGFTSTGSQVLSVASTLLRLACGDVLEHPVLKPQDVQYSYDEHNWRDVETVFFYMTTLPSLILRFPGAGAGQMAYCGLTHPYKGFFRNLIRFWRRKDLPLINPGFFRQDIKQDLHLKLRGGWTLDGELYDGPLGKDDRIDMMVRCENPITLLVPA